MASKQNNVWITGRYAVGEPRLRVICLPQAGAGAGAFSGWRKHVPPGVNSPRWNCPDAEPGRVSRCRRTCRTWQKRSSRGCVPN